MRKMKTYTPKEELRRVLNGENIGYFPRTIVNWVPVAEVMRSIGQTSLWEVFYIPEAMAKLALATHEVCKWNGIQIGWASTIEMEAMGCEIEMKKTGIGNFPKLVSSPFKESLDIHFNENEVLNSNIFNVMFEATRLVKKSIVEKYDDGIPIYASVIAPLTVASYMTDINKILKFIIKDPERVKDLLDVVSDINILYAEKMLEAGAEFLHISDPVAQGLKSEQFENIVLPSLKKIRNSFQDVKIILHICGKTGNILEHLPETGFDGFSFDYPSTYYEQVKEVIGDSMAIIGSVPTITHMLEGSKKDMFESSIGFITKGVDILSGSCCPPLDTPKENLRAMAEAIENWNRKKYGMTFE
jgi:[methyl-Co(III) methanol-specific corrinoid protein]:coenzyme M methyltransferase